MAEQDSHNVVNSPLSTSGSASLVDVASNLNTTETAIAGSKNSANDNSDSTSLTTNAHPQSVADLPPSHAELSNTTAEAEPSAGIASSQMQELDEENTPDASAEPSIASDNENGKQDAADQLKDENQHNRTNSLKKPATFSRVSITKNFLAKSASVVPVMGKTGEKAAPPAMAAPLALKPRLVAKSASSLSNALRARAGTDGTPGPEAGTVWNKNRPAPTVAAKQFTDEELKQQYGIHLATRLQTDENGKGSKWADIDDDEDDWAPEAVVWMDGTKSTLASADIPTELSLARPSSDAAKPSDAPKPSLTAMKKLGDSSSTIKTILKPGAAAAQAKQQNDLAANTAQSDKPTLKAKSPAPVPVKSPWAQLPPVEKVSPINPPVQAQSHYQPPFASQDVRVSEGFAPANVPTREIAADTFDRSWREGEGERRELFNSASGKYEPAPEGRRNSIKHDSFGRKPAAVLSRMSQDGRVNGDAGFTHRRGSSVSHASGPSARRMSFGRGSDSVISDQPSGSGVGHDLRPTPIGHTNPWNSQLPPVPATLPDGEDPVKVQERIMREKREAARLRRQEEEAQEEVAKQARLKAKLDALAGAGLSRKDRQAAVEIPAQDVDTESKPAIDAASAATAESDVLANGEQADLVASSLLETSPRLQTREHLSPSTASRATFQSQSSGSYRHNTQQTSAFSSPGDRDRKLQPFGRSAASTHDSFTPWPSTSATSNVWGVAGIGNGTFEASSMFAPMQQQTSTLPPPPGMGRPGTSSRVSPQALGQSSSPILQDAPLAEQDRSSNAAVGQSRAAVAPSQGMGRQQHVPGPIGPPSRSNQHQGQHQRDSVSAWQAAAERTSSQYHLDAGVADALKLSDSALGEPRRAHVFKETFRQSTGFQGRLGGPRSYEKPEYSIHDAQGSRLLSSMSNPVPPNAQTQPLEPDEHAAVEAWEQRSESAVRLPDGSQNPAHGGKALQQPPIAPPSISAVPSHAVNRAHFTTAPLAPAPAFSNVTPPPPETSSHPVFAGITHHPNVRLPPPPPVVKLPPAIAHIAHSATMPQRHVQNWGPPGHGQPIVKDREWQARFNGLLGRASIQTETPPSPPRTPPKGYAPVMAVASSSRTGIDEAHLFADATISLPQVRRQAQATPFKDDNSSDRTSKQMVQHIFNDELGFGSRPRVRIPKGYKAPEGTTDVSEQTSLPAVAQSKPDLPLFHLFYKRPGGIFVKLSGLHRSRFMPEGHKPRSLSTKVGPKIKSAGSTPKKDFFSSKKMATSKTGVEAVEKSSSASAPSSVRKRGFKKASPAPATVASKSA